MSKTCFKCGCEKPLSEFYKHPETKDGHLNKCKECTRNDRRIHKETNPRAIFDSRIKACAKSPSSKNAYRVIESAIKAGVLSRPDHCSGCGCSNSEHRIEAHHYDYSKPLDVIWLCTPCHRRLDAMRRAHEGKEPYGKKVAL